MPSIQSWCDLIGIPRKKFKKEECLLFEAEIFSNVCKKIKEKFKEQYMEYFCVMKFTIEMEKNMLEVEFLRLIISDILSTDEYNLEGIANYTNTPKDVIQEVVSGLNLNPSANFLQRIIELHRSVRREWYELIMKKIISEYRALA